MNWKLWGSFASAGVLLSALIVLAFRIKDDEKDKWGNLAVIVLGLSLGWLLGIYLAPYGKSEGAHFREIAEAVSAFFSGYLVAKVDGLITKVFSPEQVMRPVAGFRVAAAISSLVLSLIVTYVARVYG